jgi:tricorn protease
MELFSEAEGKDALIIDVRFNGGGWTTDFLLNILMTPEHAFTVPRGGGIGYPQGRRTFYNWSKPVIVLCNEFSYSNAEIFSHAIKTLNRGTIIGNQTFGAVISTGGKRLLNGASVRRPFRGWFVKGSNINQEKIGALPDHIVIPAQIEQIKGIDSQLNKALDVFKSGL